jgi:hypothetical protein
VDTYTIDDGVRRAKAAELHGLTEIWARVDGGAERKIQIDLLRSPKHVIPLTARRDIEAWQSINDAMDADPDLLPPIDVRPGATGIPVAAVQVGT